MNSNKTKVILGIETIFLEMLFFILRLTCTLTWADSESCPEEYARLRKDHTYCLPPNPKCNLEDYDVTPEEIDLILKLHNKYRSQVAMGQETRAGGLPTASDMLEMVWDEELAFIAQRWADNCIFDHDCNPCRGVPNFPVGQNIDESKQPCYTSQCVKPSDRKRDWGKTVKRFYDEVKNYYKSWLSEYWDRGGKETGHFTQVVWAKTWRIGCGFAAFVKRKTYTKFYVCNYGPAGNIIDDPVYEQGKPGSACPINSCIGGETCTGGKDYPGLCKMLDPNTAPIYRRNLDGLLFFCNSTNKAKDCAARVVGPTDKIFTRNLQGSFTRIELHGGQSTTISFGKPISPNRKEFCIRFVLKKRPYYSNELDESTLKVDFELHDGIKPKPMYIDVDYDPESGNQFMSYDIDLGWEEETSFSLTYSVRNGAGKHELNIKEILAFDGYCNAKSEPII